ncbi:MAG TPA: DUF1045 domain-containing protein [Candidatus Saccharimonadales bacterium]|nr:DUF1045 domain-containing protein [Candidatus Saccharimonadales bacterium]
MDISHAEPQTIPCDIALLPDEEQSNTALQASQALGIQGGLFTLDDQHFYAHVSLYMFQMNVSDQNACITALQQIARHTGAQQLAQNGYHYQSSGHYKGYVDIAFAKTKETSSLQAQVVATFNNLRADMREKDTHEMTNATGLALENFQKYGYPAIGELFRPHITLTKFPVEIEPDLSILPPVTAFSGEFARIGLFERGPSGTCIRKIAEFSLVS